MSSIALRRRAAGFIGNVLEHYDGALYGLLAPFIAPIFFGDRSPITALIFTYAIIPLGFLAKPLGAVFFGWLGDRFGRGDALLVSFIGMSVVTVSFGLLPTYQQIGALAPLLVASFRLLQSFFSSGEVVGAALFVLEDTPHSKRGLVSSLYDSSSVFGMLLASFLISIFYHSQWMDQGWRILFWLGALPGIVGIYLRASMRIGIHSTVVRKTIKQKMIDLYNYVPGTFLSICLASGFSYTTYSLAFTLMNGYIPLVTDLSKSDVIQINSYLLVVDMLALPIFGYISQKIGKERLMSGAALCAAMGALPVFYLLSSANLVTVILVRLFIVLCGVAFAAPYYAWAMDQVKPEHRYTVLAISGCIGSQLIGAPTAAISLWLFKITNWAPAPSLYLTLVGLSGLYSIRRALLQKSIFSNCPS